MKTRTGWVACDYTQDDALCCVRHGRIYRSSERAAADVKKYNYEGLRWVGEDGYLYVEPPEDD